MSENDSKQTLAKTQQDAAEELTRAVQAGAASASALDNTLVWLSGGALVFSMTFVEQFAPLKLLLPVLFSSWVAFGVSLISVVLAMRAAERVAYRTAIDVAKLLNEIDKAAPMIIAAGYTATLCRDVALHRSVRWLNICALSTFSLGLGLLGVFAGCNLWAAAG